MEQAPELKYHNHAPVSENVTMRSTEIITLKVPWSETETLFLQRVVLAAIQTYRNGHHTK